MTALYVTLAIIALLSVMGYLAYREAKSAGYNKRELEGVREAEKQREESKKKIENVDAMCRTRPERAKSWLREKTRNQKLRDR